MIPIESEFTLNLAGSCTTEEAVARLLGMGGSTIRESIELPSSESIQPGEEGLFGTGVSLVLLLTVEYAEARSAYSEAVPEDATEKDVQQAMKLHGPDIEEAEAFIEEARSYMLDIVDELSKGEGSALRLDKEATAKSGVAHITLRSLEAWSESKYSVKTEPDIAAPAPDVHALLETVKDVDGTKKSDSSLYVTLALAVQAFAEKAGGKFNHDGVGLGVNVLQVAKHLAQGSNLPGQSEASIRGRLTKAMNYKRIVKGH